MSAELFLMDYKKLTIEATDSLKSLECEALEKAALVGRVTNGPEQEVAVAAQAILAKYIRAVKDAEETMKSPLNELRGKIIALSKQMIAEADTEGNRIGALVAEFQEAENIRLAAARRAQDEMASDLERERDEKLAKSITAEEQDRIREEYREQLIDQTKPIETTRTHGQVVKQDWQIEVTDIWLLARAKPSCVKIEPRLSEIKALLNAGVKVEGVTARKVTKSSVRLKPESEAINV